MFIDRRAFLKTASWGALAQLAGASPLRSMAALAESNSASGSSTDYKALICMFLRGGNDANNMIVPLDATQFSYYRAARGPLALEQSSLLSLRGIGYGLHPAFVTLNQAFTQGSAAFIANVGPLVQPTTVDQVKAGQVQLPDALMSHQDQQEVWETGGYHSGTGPGWAGQGLPLIASALLTMRATCRW